ncbi:MAG: GNAT family N-acetyltransferase [Polyangiaceae bacterium]
MATVTHEGLSNIEVRPLEKRDLDAVVALDKSIVGRSRRGYFERRVASALRVPKTHLQIAAVGPSGLVGFILARVSSGEYGRPEPAVLLEAVGVAPSAQHAGLGRRLMGALGKKAEARGIRTVVTEADWRNHSLLKFLDGSAFRLAPRLLLERVVARMPLPDTDEAIEEMPPRIRHLRADDFDAVVRIDKLATGRDRSDYFRLKFDEALLESGIAVSLVTEDDGFVVAFAMVRVDLGDFGHIEPTATLETIGVNPSFSHKGYARDMLTQMIDNLAALHVDHLETEVAHDHFELMAFFCRFGFVPSQRLVWERRGQETTPGAILSHSL